jgi:NADH dehydrogenase [ubiquinone] 1 alpha subcomplex assembly factor 1
MHATQFDFSDPARIRQVGLMIAARQAGPFELHIRRICLA